MEGRLDRSTHTGWVIVANGEPSTKSWEKSTCVAILGSTSDLGSCLPNELGEVAPLFKVGEIRVGFSIEGRRKQWKLAVVPHLCWSC